MSKHRTPPQHQILLSNRGFTVVEVLSVVVVLSLMGATGWFVAYKQYHKPAQSNLSTGSSQSNSTTSTKTTTQSTTQSQPASSSSNSNLVSGALAYGKQSGTLQIDNGSLQLNSVVYVSQFGNTYFSGGKGAIVDVNVKNTTDSDQTYDLSGIALQLPDGNQISLQSIIEAVATDVSTVSVSSGGSVEQQLVFAPIDTSEATAGQGDLIYTSPDATQVSVKAPVTFKSPYN